MKWPTVHLGELVSIKGGGTPSKNVEQYWGGDIPWASVKDFKSRDIMYTQDYITQSGVNNSATNLIPKGTIIIPTRMALGKLAITACDMAINQDLKAIFINDNSVLHQGYLARFLESKASFIENEGKGATVKGITLDFLKSIKVPLPPLTEQKRIAAILDKADAIRQKRQQAITLADDFLRSVFLDMFGDPVTNPKGWEITNIGSLCTVSSGSTPSRQRDDYYKGSIPWVKTTEINGYTIMDTEEHISEEALQESSCRLNEVGSILIAMYGQGKTRGKVGLLGIKAATNQACAVLSPSQKINMHYLYGFLSLSYENLRRLGQGGGQPNLNAGIIKAFSVPLPPQSLQDKFAATYEKIKSLQKEKETAQQQKNILLSSLSKKIFSSQL